MSFVCQKGARVGNRYELERLLGEGGMGEVWSARHTVTKKPVALKFLKGRGRPEERRRFLREARAASAVHHPAVVPIHDILEEDGTPVLVMDLLIGRTLGTHLAQRGALSVNESAQLLAPVISAVGTAHAIGIVHRDLKPDNIFITDPIEGHLDVKVLDFGVAKLTATEGDAAQTGGLTRTGEILGTPYYMSPEQVFGEHDVDHRADIWSLGVILYECLAGHRPFEGDNVGQILKKVMMAGLVPLEQAAPQVPQAVAQMVNRMLSVDKSARLQDLREVLELLRLHTDQTVLSFGTAQPRRVIAPSGTGTDPFSKTQFEPTLAPRRRPWLAPALIVAAAAMLGSGGVWFWLHRARPPVAVAPQHPIAPAVVPPVAAPPKTPPAEIAAPQQTPPVTATPPAIATPPSPSKHVKRHGPSHAAPPSAGEQKSQKLPGGVVDQVPF